MSDPAEPFGLFLSCIEGQPVARFGTKVLLGAERDRSNPKSITYRPKVIIPIPKLEARKYGREYRRAIENGSVTQHTAAEWREQQRKIREVGAPREKLKSAPPAQKAAKEPANDHPEGGSKLG